MEEAFKVVPLAVVNPSQVAVAFNIREFVRVEFRANRLVVEAVVAKRLVEVTFDPVPLVKVRRPRDVAPRTVKVLVTVLEDARNPPYSWRVEVAKDHRAETEAILRGEGALLARVASTLG